MQQKLLPDPGAETPLASEVLKKLDDVLQKLQAQIAVSASPEDKFALIHLVEGLSLEEWRKVAKEMNIHGWLALPIDAEDGMPLLALRETLEELVFQRDHDTLTGLANRRLFDRKLQQELERAYRTVTPLSLLMLDLDHFKSINDTHGHVVGDTVLKAMGDLLLRSLRVYDIPARVGGEEFCVILPGANSRQASDLGKRLLAAFSGIVFEGEKGKNFNVTFSAGVATSCLHPETTPEKLFSLADKFLYEAKNTGRNRVVSKATKSKMAESPSLVQAVEKQFLFTGKS